MQHLIDIAGEILDFIQQFRVYVDVVWNFLNVFWELFGLTLLVEFALFCIGWLLTFVGDVATWLGAAEVGEGMTFVSDMLASDFVEHLYGAAGYLLDFIVPVQLANQILGMMVVMWLLGHVVEFVVWTWKKLPLT
jgi:hypothetical protein